MKIAYLINHPIWRDDGVTKKIAVQADAWRARGHDVLICCITRKVGPSILPAKQYLLKNPALGRLKLDRQLWRDLDAFAPDIVYLRYDVWSATIARVIARYKTVAELNTLDVEEYRLLMKQQRSLKAALRFLTYVMLRGRLFRRLAGVVGVTHEIAAAPNVAKYALPSAVVPNGIDLATYATLQRQRGPHDPLRLFFIATPGQPWHGVDLIVELARRLPDFEFHIVGIGSGAALANTTWHGYLDQAAYVRILERCHVCIGSLALFRNRMREACPLKVREYLAYGFPVILGYKDTAFADAPTADFVLEIDLEAEGVTDAAVRKVREFCLGQRDRVVRAGELAMIDAQHLERRRLDFMRRVAGDSTVPASVVSAP